jgi:hypothetical protein
MLLFLMLQLVHDDNSSAKTMNKFGHFSDLEKYPTTEVTYT